VNIQILKTRVTAKSRNLDVKWRLIYRRWDIPSDLDLTQFPHVVQVQNHNEALMWCVHHVGPVDHAWSYKDSEAILFKDLDQATQFQLSL
jgi:hypothetical protein